MLNLEWALKLHLLIVGWLVLADTGEIKKDKEKNDINIETMLDELLAVKTMKTVSMGLAMVMCMVVI